MQKDTKLPDTPRIFSSSIKKVKPYRSRTLCPRCGGTPFLSIHSIIPLKIKLTCHWCNTEWIKAFTEIEKESFTEKREQQTGFCHVHKEQKNEFYCKLCEFNFCQKCHKEFEGHYKEHYNNIVNLKEFSKKEHHSRKIKEAKDYVEFSERSLKKTCVQRLREEIRKIQATFKKIKSINSLIMDFVDLVSYNYNQNDYVSMVNLVNNTKFNLRRINERQSNEDILEQVNKNYILTPEKDRKKYPIAKYATKIKKQIGFHNHHINSLCLLKDGRIVSGSSDRTIKVTNPLTSDCEITINEHTDGITDLNLMKNGNLISSSRDKTAKIWLIKKNSYHCVGTLKGHSATVLKCIEVNDDFIASSSSDRTIKLWRNESPFENVRTLVGHTGIVYSMIKLRNFNTIVSASKGASADYGEGSIRFWDLKSRKSETIVKDVSCCWINSLIEMKRNIVLSGCYEKICMINAVDRKVIQIIDYSRGACCFIALNEEDLIFGNTEGCLVSFNINDDQPIAISKIHEDGIHDIIYLNNNTLCTCSMDQTLKIWTIENVI